MSPKENPGEGGGLSLSLDEKLRRFSQRIAEEEAQPPKARSEEELVVKTGPAPLDEKTIERFCATAEYFVSGDGRYEYLAAITGGFGMCEDPMDPMNFAKSRAMATRNSKVIKPEATERLAGLPAALLSDESYLATVINFLHWIWLLEECPWAHGEIPEEAAKAILALKPAWQQFFKENPQMRLVLLRASMLGHDLVLLNAVEKLSSAKVSSAARDISETIRLLAITQPELERLRGLAVLDIGSGLSIFAQTLRSEQVHAESLDELSVEELIEEFRQRLARQGVLTQAAGALQVIESDMDLRRWHTKGKAEDIPKIFSGRKFRQMYACSSIMHQRQFEIYREDPMILWKQILGAIQGLDHDGGELRISISSLIYTPDLMEKVMAPLLLALAGGRFEIGGAYDENSELSFEKIVNSPETELRACRAPTIRIRRHPASNPELADFTINRILAGNKGRSILSP